MDKIEDIKKLSPREKLAKLKELEKKNKQEIELARKMIEESEREVEIEEEMKEKVPIPEVKAVDIDELFSAEAKEIFKAKRFIQERHLEEVGGEGTGRGSAGKGLEDTVREEARNARVPEGQVQYGLALEEAKSMAEKLAESYDTIKSLVNKRQEAEYLTNAEQERLNSYSEMANALYLDKFSPGDDEQRERMMAAEKLLYNTRVK